jgi:hypothetical protein
MTRRRISRTTVSGRHTTAKLERSISFYSWFAPSSSSQGGSRVSTLESLGGLVTQCDTDRDMPGGLRDQLHVIMNKFLPGSFAKTLEFKSYVRAVARQIPTSGHCSLSEEAEDALFQRCPDLLSQLPVFRPAQVLKRSEFLFSDAIKNARPQHSSVLAKVLDHSVFQHFRFLTPC